MTRVPLLSAALAAVLVLAVPALAQAPAPGAETGGVRGIERSLATVTGFVDPNGAATEWFFEYGTTGFGASTDARSAGAGTDRVAVSAQLGALRPATRYRYRLVARSDGGTVRGAQRFFTTSRAPAPAPVVNTGAARDIDQRQAAITGSYNSRGRDGTWYFEYGPTTDYGATTDRQPVDPTGGRTVEVRLADLAPATLYHYRLVLELPDGVRRGDDRRFTTAREPNGLLIVANPERVLAGRSTQIAGVLAGSDNTGKRIAVQVDTFPFDGTWTGRASGMTDATGAYEITLPSLTRTAQVRTVAATRPQVTSQAITIPVELEVTMRVDDRRVRRGEKVTFSGTVGPGQAGARVLIQRRVDGEYDTVRRTRQRAAADGASRYERRLRIRRSGRYRVVALSADGGNEPGTSDSIRIRARR